MAGPSPNDSYNPVPQVAPQTGMPNDTLSVRANPNAFGSQVGQSISKAGDTLQQGENDAFQVEIQKLGIANEHAATAGEMQLAVQGGQIYDKYKSMTGLDAANSKDAAVKDYMALSDKIRSSLGNPAAQRAYDQMATRRISFTVQDMNGYAADQTVKAYRDGNTASSKLATEEASNYDVASNPTQVTDKLGTVIFNTNTKYTAPVYGIARTIPATTGPTGRLQFDTSTPQGKNTQAMYDNEINQQTDQVHTNVVKTLAFDAEKGNIATALKYLDDHKPGTPGGMSPATYANLNHSLYGPYQNEQAREDSSDVMSNWASKYQQAAGGNIHGPVYATNLGNVTLGGKEFANPTTPVDGATLAANNLRSDIYKGKTLAQIADTWTTTDKTAWLNAVSSTSKIAPGTVPDMNNPVVLKSLLQGINVAEKAPKDHGAFNDQVLTQGVQNSLSGSKPNLSPGVGVGPMIGGGTHQNQVDFYSDHEPEMIQETRDRVAARGGDVSRQDAAVQRLRTSIAELRSNQDGEVRSLSDFIGSKIMDPDHPITNMNFLDHSSDPEVKAKWQRLQELDWTKAGTVQRMVNSNAEGKSSTYGTDFYSHYNDFLTGKSDVDTLSPYFGGDKSPISNTGVKVLAQTAEDMKTPQGQAFRANEAKFLEDTHGKVVGTKVFPGIDPAILKKDFDDQLMALVPQIESKKIDMINRHEDPNGMFDPDNKDYVGKNIKPLDFDKGMKALVTSGVSGGQSTQVNTGATSIPTPQPKGINQAASGLNFKSLAETQQAYNDKKISWDQATKYSAGKGWITLETPDVQVPKPQ